jgi:2'-5' RNA ligase
VTLADVFAVDWERANLIGKLSELLAQKKPLDIKIGDDTAFGPPESPVLVALLENTPALQSLHEDIVNLLEGAEAVFNMPAYTRAGFTPHSTIQKGARVSKGDTVRINALTIVDMFPHGDWQQRKASKTIRLGKLSA